MGDIETQPDFEPHRYLSAPWRMRYLTKGAASGSCVFCDKLTRANDIENLVLWRGETIAMVMNLFPYSTGHLMLLPYEHVASPEELGTPHILTEIALQIPQAMRALRRVLSCQGFNTGMNTGSAAGAGIADHLHMHIVPRWNGDANFMPVIGNVTVMPEALSVTYAKLRAELMVERDPSRPLRALVLSPDRSTVFVVDEVEESLPRAFSDHERSLVSIMRQALAGYGVDASVAGFAGDDLVVWQAHSEPDPILGRWVALDQLPPQIGHLAVSTLEQLAIGDS